MTHIDAYKSIMRENIAQRKDTFHIVSSTSRSSTQRRKRFKEKSSLKYQVEYAKNSRIDIRPLRLTVRTSGFHPGNRGSTPLGVTKRDCSSRAVSFICNISDNFVVVKPCPRKYGIP